MSVSAAQVKELRERTGLGMMECKQALTETGGDMEAAADLLRKRAGAKVEKKSGRTAAEGVIGLSLSADRKLGAIAEVNCETDFVAKGDNFSEFANAVAAAAATGDPADADALNALSIDGGDTVAKAREALVMKRGENVGVRRFVRYGAGQGPMGPYVHSPRKLGRTPTFSPCFMTKA